MIRFSRTLMALIAGQICLHGCMAGVRMATPLQVLRLDYAQWTVGVLLALFAIAPIALALPTGRLADRRGYHHPMRIAVVLTFVGSLLAVLSTWFDGARFGLLCATALFVGAGANVGLITIQRTAGREANDPVELKRIFRWLGLAPALANAVGPLLAGVLIDAGGFRLAFGVLASLPLIAWWWAQRVPVEPSRPRAPASAAQTSFDLLRTPGLGPVLLVNWVMSASWEVHAFVLPVLGHERGFSASAIGTILGLFAVSVAGVRLVIPTLAHRLREVQVLVGAMILTAAVFAIYPLMRSAVPMAFCAAALGMALGSVQPMIMSAMHQITPAGRHGEMIALRSMSINASSAVMPLVFGAVGAALGVGSLFWVMGSAVGAGCLVARRIRT